MSTLSSIYKDDILSRLELRLRLELGLGFDLGLGLAWLRCENGLRGTTVPGSELARVLLADSLQEANWPGSEKAANLKYNGVNKTIDLR